MESEPFEEVVKSPRDKKQYKIIQLPNRLRALLISKELLSEYQKELSGEASVAMCVNVGQFQDPPSIQGLAHLTEHMLFLGTTKFPKENGLEKFVMSAYGSSNAYTKENRTVFHFDVQEWHLPHALDIFSQFFISPLFKPDSLQKEIKAIDCEFLSICTNDFIRKDRLFSLIAKTNHPLRKFGWGNTNSLQDVPSQLKVDIHKEIRRFYSSYYTARNMALVIQSALPISELQEMVTKMFSLVKDGPVPCREFDPNSNPFDLDRFNNVYWVESSENKKSLLLSWSFNPINIHYKAKPFQFLSKIFERQNKGSLIYVLRRKHLATEIVPCLQNHFYVSSHSIFNIYLELTDYGFDNICETISLVLSFVEFLKLNICNYDMFYEECKKLEYYNFDCDALRVIEVPILAENLFLFEPEDVITGGFLFYEFKGDLLLECLKHLTHQEMNITVFSQTLDKKQLIMKEPRSGFSYSKNDIPISWKNKFNQVISDTSFQIPDSNIFFPLNFDFKIEEDNLPSRTIPLVRNTQSKMYYVKRKDFDLPKAYLRFQLFSPIVISDPQTAIALELVFCIMNKYLREECSDAICAKFHYDLVLDDTGLVINLRGFNDKIFILFTSILNKLAHFKIDDSFFDITKHYLERFHYNNFVSSIKIAREILETLLLNGRSTLIDKQFVLQFITKDEVLTIFKEFLANLYIESIIEGNITIPEAIEYHLILKKRLLCSPMSPTMHTKVRVNKLPPKSFCCRVMSWNKEEYVSVVFNYYQIGTFCEYDGNVVDLLIKQIKIHISNELRTQEQLAYGIDCNKINFNGVQGLFILVQNPSKKFSCDYIYQRIQAFIDRFTSKLLEVTTTRIATFLPEDAEPLRNAENFSKLVGKLKNEEFPIISVQIVGKNDPVIKQKRKFCTDINQKMLSKSVKDILIKCPCCKRQNCVGKCVKVKQNPLLKIKQLQNMKDMIFIRSIDYFKKSMETYPVYDE